MKANVLFFDRRPKQAAPWTEALWVYDLRTNNRFTLKERPLRQDNLRGLVMLARLRDRPTRGGTAAERWRCYHYAELAARERLDLDLSWLKEAGATGPATLPPPAKIAASIADELEAALGRFRAIAARLADGVFTAYAEPKASEFSPPSRARAECLASSWWT